MNSLESRPGVEELAEPEVTTTSGRQTEMRATQIITVITNFIFAGNVQQHQSVHSANAKVETGPILDVIPTVLSDGYTIDLTIIASLTEFLGYDQPTNTTDQVHKTGEKNEFADDFAELRIRKASAHVKLWDGQTVVLGGMKTRFYDGGKEVGARTGLFCESKSCQGPTGRDRQRTVGFHYRDLVDPAGNRIHSDEEMPFAEKSVPPQGGPMRNLSQDNLTVAAEVTRLKYHRPYRSFRAS